MPASYTDLGFVKQAAGEALNTWGDPNLNRTLDRITYAIAGYRSVAITGDYTLTSSNTSTDRDQYNAYHRLLKFTGTLAANATITVPSVAMDWVMWNATNKTLTFTTGAGNTYSVEAGDKLPVSCDSSNVNGIAFGSYNLKDYIAAQVIGATGALPAVTGNAGKFVYTDGASSYWKQALTTDLGDYSTAVLGVQVALAVAL